MAFSCLFFAGHSNYFCLGLNTAPNLLSFILSVLMFLSNRSMHTVSLHLLTSIAVRDFFKSCEWPRESTLFDPLGKHIGSEGGVTWPRSYN